ncbi:MAG: hypothetical protein LBF68_07105 [Christensenellaceae bacterium]|jgi:hypothetical protein|nr:hypothetical protein [Christensenellaceae bacterium]
MIDSNKTQTPYENVFIKSDNLEQDTKAKKIIKVLNVWYQAAYDMSMTKTKSLRE